VNLIHHDPFLEGRRFFWGNVVAPRSVAEVGEPQSGRSAGLDPDRESQEPVRPVRLRSKGRVRAAENSTLFVAILRPRSRGRHQAPTRKAVGRRDVLHFPPRSTSSRRTPGTSGWSLRSGTSCRSQPRPNRPVEPRRSIRGNRIGELRRHDREPDREPSVLAPSRPRRFSTGDPHPWPGPASTRSSDTKSRERGHSPPNS
jgi:hypothetical protein